MKSYNSFTAAQRSKAARWAMLEVAAGRRSWVLTCQACGQDGGIVQPHSEDYSEPYGLHIGAIVLCHRCHMMVHHRDYSEKAQAAWLVYCSKLREGWRGAALASTTFAPINKLVAMGGWDHGDLVNQPRACTILDLIHRRELPVEVLNPVVNRRVSPVSVSSLTLASIEPKVRS